MIISLALLLGAVSAAVVAPRDAAITAAPELRKRVDISTFAWYSDYEFGGTVEWDYLTYDADSVYYTTTGSYYRRCPIGAGSSCPMWTSCSSGYMLAATTSSYCGMYIATCSYDVLYSTYGASSGKTRYWCDDTTYTGITVYATSPVGVAASGFSSFSPIRTSRPTPTPTPTPVEPSLAIPSSEESTATPATPVSSGSTTSPSSGGGAVSPTPISKSGGGDGSKKAGIIAGATIGGIALIGAFALAIIFLLRRRSNPAPQQYAPQPPVNPSMAAMASMPEKHPMTNAAMVQDPRASNYYAPSMSPPVSPAPQYPGPNINELGTHARYP